MATATKKERRSVPLEGRH